MNTLEKTFDYPQLIALAQEMTKKSYAPYSKFCVGAAILSKAGEIYGGCNVENISYGLTICAERNAIFAAVANEGPSMRIMAVVVDSSPTLADLTPCGACRQVLQEFGPEAIVLYKKDNAFHKAAVGKLLPSAFVQLS